MGKMEAVCLEANDSNHYVRALKQFRRNHRWLRRIYLVHDGGPSPTGQITKDYLAAVDGLGWPRFTPSRAPRLDPARWLNPPLTPPSPPVAPCALPWLSPLYPPPHGPAYCPS